MASAKAPTKIGEQVLAFGSAAHSGDDALRRYPYLGRCGAWRILLRASAYRHVSYAITTTVTALTSPSAANAGTSVAAGMRAASTAAAPIRGYRNLPRLRRVKALTASR
jgi:hypothetical protein